MPLSPDETTLALCGIGYVGYPVALLFAEKGFHVYGVDIDEERVEAINRGEVLIKGKEPGLADLVKKVHKKGTFKATTDTEVFKEADFIIVAVQTPVGSENKRPSYNHLKAALTNIGKNLKKGATVIIESTVAPGTTEGVARPILEKESGMKAGKDFHLVHCPERLMPGHLLENIQEYNRVIGGLTPECAERAKELYRYIVKGDLDTTDVTTAEVVKTGENTYRDVQIAFANEMALVCEALGANVWDVRELINKCKKVTDTRPEALRQMHFPGAGVGGHCIPKDSWLLLTNVEGRSKPVLIPSARQINDFMPTHMIELLGDAADEAGKKFEAMNVLVLGYAYDANSDDDRNTPTQPLVEMLEEKGVTYTIHDPYIEEYVGNLDDMVEAVDAIILVTAHDDYKDLAPKELKSQMSEDNPIVIDGRNAFEKETFEKKGFIYKGVGNV